MRTRWEPQSRKLVNCTGNSDSEPNTLQGQYKWGQRRGGLTESSESSSAGGSPGAEAVGRTARTRSESRVGAERGDVTDATVLELVALGALPAASQVAVMVL